MAPDRPTDGSATRPPREEQGSLGDDPRRLDLNARLRMQVLRSRLLGMHAEPIRVGRFIVLEKLGQGAMGVVFSAYDEQLDRRIAIKMLPTRGDRDSASDPQRRRFLRETRALARLSHRNVVHVYEAGEYQEYLYIAMELVSGETLARWLDREPGPGTREIIEVFAQLAQGLAAAHDAGVIHRDFKPANVLIGDDGVPRVVDFGLARLAADSDPEPAPPEHDDRGDRDAVLPGAASPSMGHSTATGAVLGTPRYMSPEQFRGERCDARSDQFSFSVAMWEAVHGEPPFRGDTLHALRHAVERGDVTTSAGDARVPRAIQQMLRRGLSTRPADRFGDMHQLVAVLRGALQPRVWPLGLGVVAALAITATLAVWLVRGEPEAVCESGRDHIAEIWDAGQKARVGRAILAPGRAYANDAWPHLSAKLDRYAETWAAMHRGACLAHRRGEQSAVLLDRRMACLERRRVALRQAIEVIDEDGASNIAGALKVAANLPAIERCGDLEALAADAAPAPPPEIEARVDRLRTRLDQARAFADIGQTVDALTVAAEVVAEARTLGYPPLVAEALLGEGRIMILADWRPRSRAAELLREAAFIGLEQDMTALTVEAFARYVYSEGTGSKQGRPVLPLLPVAEALSKQNARDVFGRALLLNNIGATYMALEQPDTARDYYEQAVAVKDTAVGDTDIELTNLLKNLAVVTADPSRRSALWQRATAEFTNALGSNHPLTLDTRFAHAFHTFSPREARDLVEPVCAAREEHHPDNTWAVRECIDYLGFVTAELGQTERAARYMRELAERVSREIDGEPSELAAEQLALAQGFARLYDGDYRGALATFQARAALTPLDARLWWQRARAARLHLGVGVSALALGRHAAARDVLEQVVPVFEELVEIHDHAMFRHHLAWARFALARALWPGRGEPAADARARALELAGLADAWYRRAGAGYEWRVDQIATWRAERADRTR